MKRMVKNGDLIDVEPDGTITVAGKPIGGGSENDREITLTVPYANGDTSTNKKIYIDEETWNKIKNCYFETIKFYYNDGNPLGVFHVFYFKNGNSSSGIDSKQYACVSYFGGTYSTNGWYGKNQIKPDKAKINCLSDSNGKYLSITGYSESIPILYEANFDARYKLADKPTQDGTYVLKATVSGGAVTYTWVAQ